MIGYRVNKKLIYISKYIKSTNSITCSKSNSSSILIHHTFSASCVFILHILPMFRYLGVVFLGVMRLLLIYRFNFMHDLVYTEMLKYLSVICIRFFVHLHIILNFMHDLVYTQIF